MNETRDELVMWLRSLTPETPVQIAVVPVAHGFLPALRFIFSLGLPAEGALSYTQPLRSCSIALARGFSASARSSAPRLASPVLASARSSQSSQSPPSLAIARR